jgi:serralysin
VGGRQHCERFRCAILPVPFGWKEGRDPSTGFDTLKYLAENPDVAAAGTNPLDHFLRFGIYEGRQAINDGMWS